MLRIIKIEFKLKIIPGFELKWLSDGDKVIEWQNDIDKDRVIGWQRQRQSDKFTECKRQTQRQTQRVKKKNKMSSPPKTAIYRKKFPKLALRLFPDRRFHELVVIPTREKIYTHSPTGS